MNTDIQNARGVDMTDGRNGATCSKKWRRLHEGDQQLLRRVVQHDQEATREFVQRFGGLVWSILKDGVLTHDERSDMFQRVFEHLWERDCYRLRRWEGAGAGRFSSYLGVIVTRLLSDYRRNRSSGRGRMNAGTSLDEASIPVFEQPQDDPLDNLCRLQRSEVVSAVLSRMSEREQSLILRWHVFEQGYVEIADGLGITVNNARVALMRAERRLKDALLHTHPDIFGAYV